MKKIFYVLLAFISVNFATVAAASGTTLATQDYYLGEALLYCTSYDWTCASVSNATPYTYKVFIPKELTYTLLYPNSSKLITSANVYGEFSVSIYDLFDKFVIGGRVPHKGDFLVYLGMDGNPALK